VARTAEAVSLPIRRDFLKVYPPPPNSAYTGHTQKNGAVSKVNKQFMSHITRAQHTPSAAATVQVSHALPAVRFSCFSSMKFVIG
jgi:hypothetical protein